MTKFYNWLNEEEDVDIQPVLDDIGKKCGPYIRVLTSNPIDRFLVSGRKNKPNHFIGTVREDRQPRDTPKEYHEYADDLFYEKFGIRARSNTLFCATNEFAVRTYGNPYIIFPIGSYSLIWSPEISDLYGDIMEDAPYTEGEEMERDIEKAVETYKSTKRIPSSTSTFDEIMVHCKKYYALDYKLFLPKVVKWLERDYDAKIDASSQIYKQFNW